MEFWHLPQVIELWYAIIISVARKLFFFLLRHTSFPWYSMINRLFYKYINARWSVDLSRQHPMWRLLRVDSPLEPLVLFALNFSFEGSRIHHVFPNVGQGKSVRSCNVGSHPGIYWGRLVEISFRVTSRGEESTDAAEQYKCRFISSWFLHSSSPLLLEVSYTFGPHQRMNTIAPVTLHWQSYFAIVDHPVSFSNLTWIWINKLPLVTRISVNWRLWSWDLSNCNWKETSR